MGFFKDAARSISDHAGKIAHAGGRAVERGARETVENINQDFDSIATAIDKGGLLGGAVQAADVFSPGHQVANTLDNWDVIPEDPALKELISAGVNVAQPGPGSLLALKDLADAIGEIKKTGGPAPAPAAAQAAPPPASSPRSGAGYPTCDSRTHDVHGSQTVSLRELGDVLAALKAARQARADYVKQNPNAPVPTDGQFTIDEILNHPTMSTGEVCCRVVAVIVHEHPEAVEQVGAATGTEPPPAESNTQAGQAVFGMFGQIASFLGPLLSNPMVGTLLGGLLMATPLAPIAPFLPVILPLAGSALTSLGGAATQVSQGQDPTLGGATGQGPSPDVLSGLLSAIPGMLGGMPGAPAAPVPAA